MDRPKDEATTLPNDELLSKIEDSTTTRKDRMLGAVIDGRYRVLKLIGRGGMGKVYLAEQIDIGRKVALKVMQAQCLDEDDPSFKFFRQEARTLARLNHINVAQIYDASFTGDYIYIAMEYVEGESLRDRLNRESKLEVADAVHILRNVCAGLEAAHQRDIIHRDIKPGNIMLTHDIAGVQVKVLDFGIAILDRTSADLSPTGVGEFVGTPAYMSPEQIRGEQLNAASDVYSLGVVAYEMIVGTNPFVNSGSPSTGFDYSRNAWTIIDNQINMMPPDIHSLVSDIPVRIGEAIMRALEKFPLERFTSAGQFAQAL
jgi:serine/threonine-protein kinase